MFNMHEFVKEIEHFKDEFWNLRIENKDKYPLVRLVITLTLLIVEHIKTVLYLCK